MYTFENTRIKHAPTQLNWLYRRYGIAGIS
jgi:hypothetical protein